MGSVTALAQDIVPVKGKWDAAIDRVVRSYQPQTRSGAEAPLQNLIISSTDPQAVVEALAEKGYVAKVVGSSALTATLPVNDIVALAEMDEVNYMTAPRTFFPTMHNTREAIYADDVHEGKDLETPFTGKGVIVGVIDQGFEYRHLAFRDADNVLRVKRSWNSATRKLQASIPQGGDGKTASKGHGTHVAGIAAGSVIQNNKFYGVAPDAELVFVSSTFAEDDVLNSATAISEYAKKENKPYVINMSFGSQMGPHDGTTAYDQALSELSVKGGLLVGAMGNEGGENLHASYTFKKDQETKNVIFDLPYKEFYYVDVWGIIADGKQHLKVRPFVFNKITKKRDFKTASFWTNSGNVNASINPYNDKENYLFILAAAAVQDGNTSQVLGLEITGDTDTGFHLWCNPQYGSVASVTGSNYVKGDNLYCVGEGAGSVPRTVSVASFNANNGEFASATKSATYSYSGFKKGDLSYFSSRGPWLGEGEQKPTIAAPGGVVSSAFSKYDKEFSKDDTEITAIETKGATKFYYGVMSGTSMATPAVTGTIALWLEAYPELSFEEVTDIFKETAIKDARTGNEEWNENFGYGKIDAYEGLVKALQLAEISGVNDVLNTEAPVSLKKGDDAWRILFNNDESYADIALYTAGGKLAHRQNLVDIRRGNETVVNFSGLEPGVYLLRINTTLGALTRKVMVK